MRSAHRDGAPSPSPGLRATATSSRCSRAASISALSDRDRSTASPPARSRSGPDRLPGRSSRALLISGYWSLKRTTTPSGLSLFQTRQAQQRRTALRFGRGATPSSTSRLRFIRVSTSPRLASLPCPACTCTALPTPASARTSERKFMTAMACRSSRSPARRSGGRWLTRDTCRGRLLPARPHASGSNSASAIRTPIRMARPSTNVVRAW